MRKVIRKNLVYLILGAIILVHALILTKLIYFPYPELFIYPYLTNQGLKPYGQILDQHFPGLMFLPINLDNLGMTTPEVARIWSISIVVIVQVMLFITGSFILKSKFKALLVNTLFLVWQPFFEGWVLWIDSFLPLLLLPSFYALCRRWFLATGLLLGAAIVFKQTIIPLAVFAWIYIFWQQKSLKTSLKFLAGVFIPVGLMFSYLISIGVFWDFWYWTVTFNLTTYAEFGRGTGPTLAHFTRVLLVFGLAFLVIRKIKLPKAQILLIFLIGVLLGLSTRFDFVHFQPSLPFAILATVYVLDGLGRLGRFGIISLYGVITVWWLIVFYKGHLGDRVISFDSTTYELAAKVRNYTLPGEKIFVYGGAPHLYQMSATLPAGNIFVFQFPWFLKVAEGRILEGIIRDRPNIIVSDRVVKIEGQTIVEFAKDIDQYINQNYQKIDSVGTTDILRRKS
ncbi:hypothetical protein A2867_03535 [Candidatus Daviesbacteria bacterium RIFCSPHIGHO2_01_FULL_40_11]|uniref:Glycosyltransferase RgtA/B/C/D-like domain-containing protein n=1 Tax=Candidatus Daviesbacteria bacterium RIFCSPHIGHO2_01_FULL_40_11 TaxID=1797762 RepID=A0A1F5JK33_9BACT|nr:MAG: hypothetical protein A2867_03535 [Candidatus Daviesbacteria bacterium RIFCSPHIGHO2_01_FULL_40_11]OGE62789.1 MAG: hypothetical protein A2964_01740 [Candidatus Daviesbacteria bacterium RIFCSPLOWO2_01_FULL_40_27]